MPKFAHQVYDLAGDREEIVWVDATNHIDLYDVDKHVGPAAGTIVTWFDRHLMNKVKENGLQSQLKLDSVPRWDRLFDDRTLPHILERNS